MNYNINGYAASIQSIPNSISIFGSVPCLCLLLLQKVLVWMKGIEDKLANVVDMIGTDSDTVKWQINLITVCSIHVCSLVHA